MNPADLAELLKATATAVLTEHALDTAALPATVTVERPRNPEHGDYATLALQLGKKVGVNPARAGRMAAGRWPRPTASPRRRSPAGSSTCGWTRRRRASSSTTSSTPLHLRPLRRPGRTQDQPGVRLGQPDRANPHRRHPLGRRRRRVGPVAADAERRRGTRLLFQRPRHRNRPVHQLADRRSRRRTRPGRWLRGQLHRRHRRAVLKEAPDALSQPDTEQHETFRRIGVDLMFTHIKESLHEFGTDFDVYTHEESMHSSGRVEQAIARLRENGNIYEKDGATWLRTSAFGDDKDRVVIEQLWQTRVRRRRSGLLPGQAGTRVRPVHHRPAPACRRRRRRSGGRTATRPRGRPGRTGRARSGWPSPCRPRWTGPGPADRW